MNEVKLSREELDLLSKLLGFRTLEKLVTGYYDTKSFDEKKEILLRAWKKVSPGITGKDVGFKSGVLADDLNRIRMSLMVYCKIYSGFIQPGVKEGLPQACIDLLSISKIPELKEEKVREIEKAILPTIVPKKRKPRLPVSRRPRLDPDVRRRLEEYFRKSIEKLKPALLMDDKISTALSGVIHNRLDRIIEVALRNAYRSIEYGYIMEDSKELSKFVLQESMSSIDWMIDQGLLIEDIAGELKAVKND